MVITVAVITIIISNSDLIKALVFFYLLFVIKEIHKTLNMNHFTITRSVQIKWALTIATFFFTQVTNIFWNLPIQVKTSSMKSCDLGSIFKLWESYLVKLLIILYNSNQIMILAITNHITTIKFLVMVLQLETWKLFEEIFLTYLFLYKKTQIIQQSDVDSART